ncbi:hypothetical protein Tco_0950290 [Tanacetum coccineum]
MLLQDVAAHAYAQVILQAHSKPQAKATAHVQAQMVVMTLVRVIRRNKRLIGRNYYQLTGQKKGKHYHATKQAMEVVGVEATKKKLKKPNEPVAELVAGDYTVPIVAGI